MAAAEEVICGTISPSSEGFFPHKKKKHNLENERKMRK
jgi:hypothetical protein